MSRIKWEWSSKVGNKGALTDKIDLLDISLGHRWLHHDKFPDSSDKSSLPCDEPQYVHTRLGHVLASKCVLMNIFYENF